MLKTFDKELHFPSPKVVEETPKPKFGRADTEYKRFSRNFNIDLQPKYVRPHI